MAENCDFGAMKDELIRDCLVVGIRDSSLSERLQLESELTLDRAKQLIHQRESVQCQQELLNPVKLKKRWPGESSLDAVNLLMEGSYLQFQQLKRNQAWTIAVDVVLEHTPNNHVLQKMQSVLGAIDVDTSALGAYLTPVPI